MDKRKKPETPIKSSSAASSGRAPDKNDRKAAKDVRCFPPEYTAHQFKKYRKRRGMLVREMREKRDLSQEQMGIAGRTIRRLESGQTAQVSMMHLLARLVPCPRELAKFVRNILESLPVACVKCRHQCYYQGLDNERLISHYCNEVTFSPLDDDEE